MEDRERKKLKTENTVCVPQSLLSSSLIMCCTTTIKKKNERQSKMGVWKIEKGVFVFMYEYVCV